MLKPNYQLLEYHLLVLLVFFVKYPQRNLKLCMCWQELDRYMECHIFRNIFDKAQATGYRDYHNCMNQNYQHMVLLSKSLQLLLPPWDLTKIREKWNILISLYWYTYYKIGCRWFCNSKRGANSDISWRKRR